MIIFIIIIFITIIITTIYIGIILDQSTGGIRGTVVARWTAGQ